MQFTKKCKKNNMIRRMKEESTDSHSITMHKTSPSNCHAAGSRSSVAGLQLLVDDGRWSLAGRDAVLAGRDHGRDPAWW